MKRVSVRELHMNNFLVSFLRLIYYPKYLIYRRYFQVLHYPEIRKFLIDTGSSPIIACNGERWETSLVTFHDYSLEISLIAVKVVATVSRLFALIALKLEIS